LTFELRTPKLKRARKNAPWRFVFARGIKRGRDIRRRPLGRFEISPPYVSLERSKTPVGPSFAHFFGLEEVAALVLPATSATSATSFQMPNFGDSPADLLTIEQTP